MKKWWVFLIPFLWMGAAAGVAALFFRTVDLKPVVNEKSFFDSDDRAFVENAEISKIFPEMSQPVILSATGEIHSKAYARRVEELTAVFEGLSEVISVQSLTHGPKSPEDAFKSPLWRRVLVSYDKRATNFIISLKPGVPAEKIVSKIEKIIHYFDREDFKLMISGPPFIIEIIQRNLRQDMKVFSFTAALIFAFLMLAIFRSAWILLGMVTACGLAMMGALFVTHFLKYPIGPITSNLPTIIFILTLSFITYLSFNWKRAIRKEPKKKTKAVRDALRLTLTPALCSLSAAFLGFASCIFVAAIPQRQLGVSGAIGTLIAFAMAFLVYPWFLIPARNLSGYPKMKSIRESAIRRFFTKKHFAAMSGILAVTGLLALGLFRLNPDASLLSYFKKGTPLREGLEYIDKNGGSCPLVVVIKDPQGKKLDSNGMYWKLWDLHQDLEKYRPVGSLFSQPLIMAEAKNRIPLVGGILPNDWVLGMMDASQKEKIVGYFVTDDRLRSQLFIRMIDGERSETRDVVVKKIKQIVRRHGFEPELTGGIYLLQGKLTYLVIHSFIQSLWVLMIIFAAIVSAVTLSLRAALALFASLAVIPLTLLGTIGWLKTPIDVVSAPAPNIAIAIGIDAMLYLLIEVKRLLKEGRSPWDAWTEARVRMWPAVCGAALVFCSGFAIFGLSSFPPTQRFGLEIALGSFMSPVSALFVLPVLAGIPLWRIKRKQAEVKSIVQKEKMAA